MRTVLSLLIFICIQQIGLGQWMIDSLTLSEAEIINEKDINGEHLEFAPTFYHDYIMIVKSDTEGDKDEHMDDYFLNLSYIAKNAGGNLSRQAFFNEAINSNMHEGPGWYNKTNGRLYFTRAYYDTERGTKKDTIVRKIFEAREDQNFRNPVALPFSSEKYSVFHPTLNSRGDMIIFSSDMKGSKKTDLYYSLKTDTWGEAIPLSDQINSEFHEVFPYLYKDSILFFSSNRPEGAGALDIWYSVKSDSGWCKPRTLPYPINSSFDDIGFLINYDEKSGYFSSNRPGGKGKDDIYRFETAFPVLKKDMVNVTIQYTFSILEKLSFQPIANGLMTIGEFDINASFNQEAGNLKVINQKGSKEILVKMDANMKGSSTQKIVNGKTVFDLLPNKTYLLTVIADGYEEETVLFKTNSRDDELSVLLNPAGEKEAEENPTAKTEIPTEVGSVIIFENIYYNYNSTEILDNAASELDALYESMNKNPDMKIQLSSHTDSRGNHLYNKELSVKRANSVKNYLVKKGIDESRIKTIGFGESRIRNHCTDGVTCTEEEHAYNRRTEVLVID